MSVGLFTVDLLRVYKVFWYIWIRHLKPAYHHLIAYLYSVWWSIYSWCSLHVIIAWTNILAIKTNIYFYKVVFRIIIFSFQFTLYPWPLKYFLVFGGQWYLLFPGTLKFLGKDVIALQVSCQYDVHFWTEYKIWALLEFHS